MGARAPTAPGCAAVLAALVAAVLRSTRTGPWKTTCGARPTSSKRSKGDRRDARLPDHRGRPAGLQLGPCWSATGRDYLVLEARRAPGAFFTRFPRHRQLISINKSHTGSDDPELNLRMDWNSLLSDDPSCCSPATASATSRPPTTWSATWPTSPRRTACDVRYGTRVERIGRAGRASAVDRRTARARARRRRSWRPGSPSPTCPTIPGIETAEQYDDVSRRPGGLHRPAGADHRQGQLGASRPPTTWSRPPR